MNTHIYTLGAEQIIFWVKDRLRLRRSRVLLVSSSLNYKVKCGGDVADYYPLRHLRRFDLFSYGVRVVKKRRDSVRLRWFSRGLRGRGRFVANQVIQMACFEAPRPGAGGGLAPEGIGRAPVISEARSVGISNVRSRYARPGELAPRSASRVMVMVL